MFPSPLYRTVTKVVLKLPKFEDAFFVVAHRTVTKVVLKRSPFKRVVAVWVNRTVTKVVLKRRCVESARQCSLIEQ